MATGLDLRKEWAWDSAGVRVGERIARLGGGSERGEGRSGGKREAQDRFDLCTLYTRRKDRLCGEGWVAVEGRRLSDGGGEQASRGGDVWGQGRAAAAAAGARAR